VDWIKKKIGFEYKMLDNTIENDIKIFSEIHSTKCGYNKCLHKISFIEELK